MELLSLLLLSRLAVALHNGAFVLTAVSAGLHVALASGSAHASSSHQNSGHASVQASSAHCC